ncbi:Integrin alpha 3 [Fasciola gigantica]|uniref:Integrin alpha 3 n=1 Tax=Fasciola gigantica TaxID=46835 RepID=A0A504YNT0_FASGI|nr:Integrin alpha 3 [Fasciola gigantica]
MHRFLCNFVQICLIITFTNANSIQNVPFSNLSPPRPSVFSTSNLHHRYQQQQSDLIFPFDAVKRYAHTESGSYFGYSVAAYVGQAQSFCLVGAPKAKLDGFNELPLSAFSPNTEDSTGLVYRLDLDTRLPYCSLVPIATTDEARKEYGTPTPGSKSSTEYKHLFQYSSVRMLLDSSFRHQE